MKAILRPDLVHSMMQEVEYIYNRMWERPCIYLDEPILTSLERKRRLTVGDLVYVNNGEISDCYNRPTHRIIKCESNESGTYKIITALDPFNNISVKIRVK